MNAVDTLKYDGHSPASGPHPDTTEKEQELDAEKRSTDYDGSTPPGSTSGHEENELTAAERRTERRFLWKLDLLLMTWAWCAYCMKMIDGSNYKTAYVSGMKEDLNLFGNELNWMETTWRIGYALFLIPSQLVLADGRIPARIWLPACEVLWGICVGLMACMKNATGLYVCRFFLGVFEASSYPGIISVLCEWYTPKEIAARVAIFSTSYPGAMIFTSSMQAALSANNFGRLKAWQWLFVFNALMTVFIAVFGFWVIPNNPANCNVRWLNDAEQDIARKRMYRVKKLPPTKINRSLFKKVFSSWVTYIFILSYCTWTWSQNANSWITLFLKAVKNADGTKRFSVSELNAIPIGGYVLQIVVMLAVAWLSDRKNWRASLVIVQEVTLLIGAIILAVWPSSFGLKMFGFYILYLSCAGGPILIAWMADFTPDPSQRALILGLTPTCSFAVDSFANILIYPAKKAPNYPIGYKAAAAFAAACIVFTSIFAWADKKTRAAREAVNQAEWEALTVGSTTSGIPPLNEKVRGEA